MEHVGGRVVFQQLYIIEGPGWGRTSGCSCDVYVTNASITKILVNIVS